MVLRLKNSPFKRNRSRESSIGDIFNKTSTHLNSILSLALTIFFTPVLIASSLFSQEIVLMLINISLCLGNLSNFGYRVYNNEVGKLELILSLGIMSVFFAGGLFLFPITLSTATLLGAIALTNQIAVGINLFFLLRNNIVPPALGWFKSLARKLGFEVHDQFYQVKPLDLDKDDCIVNALFLKHFGHSLYEGPIKQDLKKLNLLLTILVGYINKYDEQFLGDVNYQHAIEGIQGNITQLTLKGNADSSFTFIKQKIAYKKVKVNHLCKAKTELDNTNNLRWESFSKYIKGVTISKYTKNPGLFQQQASDLLSKEIQRQEDKLERLSSCLP